MVGVGWAAIVSFDQVVLTLWVGMPCIVIYRSRAELHKVMCTAHNARGCCVDYSSYNHLSHTKYLGQANSLQIKA